MTWFEFQLPKCVELRTDANNFKQLIMMKNQQHGTHGHGANSNHARTATTHVEHHQQRRGQLDTTNVEVVNIVHAQRSKSTSNHNGNGVHHSNRDGPCNHHHSSIGSQPHENQHSAVVSNTASGRNGGASGQSQQPRSHSHAKGPPNALPAASNRENHHQQQQQTATTAGQCNGGDTSGATGTSSRHANHGGSSSSNAVGHYILGKALGEGTFGKVKLGTHVLTGEKVAVKVLEKSKIKDKKDVERISREIKILKQLHHPNVVQIYEIIETDKDLYLVMEFASGGELFELIVQNQKLKERTASKHLQELLAGVHYIHQLGICHRDLKPENLLIDFDGQLKIVDFGLSNIYERGQTLKTACGSPCYAAPEMIAGNRYHGLKSDIWSCGVVLYAMLCGFLPFEDQKTSNLYKKIMNAEYSLPKFLSNDAKDILSQIFVTDPDKRIDIEGLKKHPWYRLYQPETQNYNFHTMPRTVNEKLVMKLEASLGFSIESVQRAVENNKHNHLSATYYLLLKKYSQASYKNQQAQRSSSIQPRVEQNYQSSALSQVSAPASGSSRQRSQKVSSQNSDSKNNRPTVVTTNLENSQINQIKKVNAVGGSNSSATTPNSAKLGKGFRSKAIEEDRFKAPVQDQLVLKNHRREQSANATAGRHNRNGDWGNVADERRTESHERAAATDDYEILISKVNKQPQGHDENKSNSGQESKQTNPNANLRAHFASPSPDIGPNQNRNRNCSVNNHTKNTAPGSSGSVLKAQTTEGKSKKMEVNIHNVKQSFNQVITPSQNNHHQTRASSLPKNAPPKPATYTAATVSSTQRSAEKQKQMQKHNERQASHLAATSHHRKAKSSAIDITKQISLQPNNQVKDSSYRPLVEQQYVEKSKFSQTQKIQNSTKGQQQNIAVMLQDSNSSKNTKAQLDGSTRVSDLLLNMNKQKTYFEIINGKQNAGASFKNGINQSQDDQLVVVDIEGSNLRQSETMIQANKNDSSNGIFQSLNSMQRPVIQDINSQNLLKRLESGSSDNQLKQNFVTRQSQQTKRKDEPSSYSVLTNKAMRESAESPTTIEDIMDKRASTIQVDSAVLRNQNSRLSQISQQNGTRSGYQGQSVLCKTPAGNGYQTLDSIGDISTQELKIMAANSDTDRALKKSIFYGTHRANELNHEMQRYQNDQIQAAQGYRKDFSKTQSITISQKDSATANVINRSNVNQDRSSKNVAQRSDSNTRQSATTAQPKITTQILKQHQRSSASTTGTTIGKKSDGRSTVSQSHGRQSNNGYAIPTQQSSLATGGYMHESHGSGKYHSIITNNSSKQEQQQHIMSKQNTTNSSQIAMKKSSKEPAAHHKTRSQSVSGAQKAASQVYTPASHRKGSNSQAGTNLLASNGANAQHQNTGHYRGSSACPANKDRRSSHPSHQPQNANQTQLFASSNQQPSGSTKQRSSSTTYQSAFLVKSVDHARQGSVQRNRQKSTRDSAMNSSFVNRAPQERQYQSITHASGTKASTLAQQLEETIFNQSFNGASSRYQGHAATSNSNKRKQQVASINELLNVAESLKQSHYRPRQNNQQHQQKSNEGSASDVRQKKSSLNASSIAQSIQGGDGAGSIAQPKILLSSQQAASSRKGQSVVVSDLGISICNGAPVQPHISYSSHANTPSQQQVKQAQQQPIQNELKASVLFPNQPQSATQQTQQSLSAAMQQITDGILHRQQQNKQQTTPGAQTGQYHHTGQQSSQPISQHQQQQSYLSDLFSKQSALLAKKSIANPIAYSQSQYSTQGAGEQSSQVGANSYSTNHTSQLIGYKSALYSPSNRGGSSTTVKSSAHHQQQHQNVEPNQDLLAVSYQHRAPPNFQTASKQQQQQQTSQLHKNVLQQQQQNIQQPQPPQQSFIQDYQKPLYGANVAGTTQQPIVNNLLYQGATSSGGSQNHSNYLNPQAMSERHLQTLYSGQRGHMWAEPTQHQNNYHHHLQHHSNHAHTSGGGQALQMQKPPSVPAPSTTAFQHMQEQQQLHQYQQQHKLMSEQQPHLHQQQQINFYPNQGSEHHQQQSQYI